ncbi:MAG: hypothetical protein AAB467_04995 [Patescibacteria group bacterium]
MEARYLKRFKKKFRKLLPRVQEQFYERVDLFRQNKFNQILNNHSVDPTYPNCNSINVSGDYRAIFKEQGDIVIFITIGNHSELY